MGKNNKAQALTLPRIRYMSCFELTHAPVATTARAAATGPVSMSTRPDPEGSDTVEIATRKSPHDTPRVGLDGSGPGRIRLPSGNRVEAVWGNVSESECCPPGAAPGGFITS